MTSRAEKRVKKRPKQVQKCQQKNSHVREKELKRPKKYPNGFQNTTIQIVVGHLEQNEPLFVCLGREYSFYLGREYITLVRKRPKKNVKMD